MARVRGDVIRTSTAGQSDATWPEICCACCSPLDESLASTISSSGLEPWCSPLVAAFQALSAWRTKCTVVVVLVVIDRRVLVHIALVVRCIMVSSNRPQLCPGAVEASVTLRTGNGCLRGAGTAVMPEWQARNGAQMSLLRACHRCSAFLKISVLG